MYQFFVDEYTKADKYSFPKPDVSPEKKRQHEYILKNVEAIYAAYSRERTAITYTDQARFDKTMKYAAGNQPSDYYKNLLVNTEDTDTTIEGGRQLAEQRRKAWLNIDFENIVSYGPKVRDHLHGLFRDMEQDVIGYPIDQDSGMMMQDKKYELATEMYFQKQLAELREAAREDQPGFDFFPLDQAELDMYEASGGFKLNFAKAMEKLVAHTFNLSNYEQLKDMWIDDAATCGFIASKKTEDVDTEEIKIDRVDPRYLVVQYSDYPDHRDSEFAGEIKPWSMSVLGNYVDDLNELIKFAKMYTGKMGNPDQAFWNGRNTQSLSFEEISHFKIPVFECYYIDYEDTYMREHVNRFGKRRIISADYGYQPKNNNDKVTVTRNRYVYQGFWIIGTDRLFNYGLTYDQERQKGKDVKLPIKVFKVTDKPIHERLIPIYDQMAIGWFKFQNAQAMAINSGIKINTRMFNDINIGGSPADPLEVAKFGMETGIWFYSDHNEGVGEGYQGGGVDPVNPVEGGMRNDLLEGMQKFRWAVEMIEHIAGISDVAMGSQTAPESKATNTELSVQGSQNVIRPLVQSIMDLKGETAKTIMFNLQLRVRHNEQARKAYEKVIGVKDVRAIAQATTRGARFGVHFEPRPTRQEFTELYNMITQSMSAGKDGQPLLEADEALMIKGELEQGSNLKDIRLKLSYKIRKRKEEQRRYALITQEQTNKHTMQQSAQKHKQEMEKEQLEQQGALKEQQLKQQGEESIAKLKANEELKQLIYRLASDEEQREMEKTLRLKELEKPK